ncbi:MAG: electron transfer flavoprotein beta subunit lysine methyltransferase-like [Fibrobacteres bacterium]|nr:electron transfer flavoprotein beta subunit lysine methyltransferase-like [Fibrobacterota bacterium]
MRDTIPLPSESLIARLAPLAPVPGRPDLVAHQAPDVFAVWQTWEKESGAKQDIPYWATVWPAALMTARFLAAKPETVAGRTVLDFGCGGGVAGIASMKAGAARAIANDIDPVALWMAERNAVANGVFLQVEDRNLLESPPSPDWDVILVADLFYEKTVAETMLQWLGNARAQGAQVFIADASRPFSPRTGVKVLMEERYPTDADLEGSSERIVRLLAYLP